MLRHDFLGRLIQQIAEFLARAAGLAKEGNAEQMKAELDAAERALNLPRGSERLDAKSIALLLGGGDKVVLAAAIFEQQAALAELTGRPVDAARLRARAVAVLAHAAPNELGSQAAEIAARLSPKR